MMTIASETVDSKGQLLVVEDDMIHRTIIGKIAAKLGYDATIAPTFEAACSLLQRQVFDAMTLDLSLGEDDGVKLLRLTSECGLQAMPIVIISGCDERILNSTRRVAESLNLTVIGSLPKPLNLDHLRAALSLPPRPHTGSHALSAAPEVSRESLLAGLTRHEFSVEFQPKIEIATGRVVGVEALARWRSPELGAISPAVFIPAAERFGLIPELTDYLIAAAITRGGLLVRQHPGFTIAVNVSGSLMSDLSIPERIERMLQSENLPPTALIVELTESVTMADVDRAIDILVRLRIKGIGTAIDDFGTGYSSLSALARLPFSELKIDRSFVKGCDSDEDMMKIVEASIALGRAFKMKVVAEGIESPQILAKLRQAGCDIGQGYLFAASMRPERVEGWMRRYADYGEAGADLAAARAANDINQHRSHR